MNNISVILWGDNDIRFVLDQHDWFDFLELAQWNNS
jgi:hypothetical protein